MGNYVLSVQEGSAILWLMSLILILILQFHADYLKQSRSYLWEQCLEPVLNSEVTHER